MHKEEGGIGEAYPTVNIRQPTPEGDVFVHITEIDDKPYEIRVNLGKTGTNTQAWAFAVAKLCTFVLQSASGNIDTIIELLSEITTGSVRMLPYNKKCRSGVEGMKMALMIYKRSKYEKLFTRIGRPPELVNDLDD